MIGQVLIERYRILSLQASTPFGDTYLASDLYRPGYPHCVLKHLKPLSDTPKTPRLLRILLEKKVVVRQKLGRGNCAPQILNFFDVEQQFYIVEEIVPGHSLHQELLPNHRLSEGHALKLLQDLLKILDGIHRQQVLHLDICPENIVRRMPDGQLLFTNFRLIREISTPRGDSYPRKPATRLPIDRMTAPYQPLEQLYGLPEPASDLYAVGMILIQALTGLSAPEIMGLRRQTDDGMGNILWHPYTDASRGLIACLDRMVKQRVQERYQSTAQVLQDLEPLWHSPTLDRRRLPPAPSNRQELTVRQPTVQQPTTMHSWLMGGILGLFLVIGSVGLFLFNRASQPPNPGGSPIGQPDPTPPRSSNR